MTRIYEFFSSSRNKFIFVMVFAWGLLAHGMIMFRKLAIHDDIYDFFGVYTPRTLSLGRWLGVVIVKLDRWLLGMPALSAPTFYVALSFLYIAVFLCMLAELFKLENRFALAALCGFTVTSPVILMLFGYMPFVPSYFPGIILVTAGGCLLCKTAHNRRNFITGSVLLCLGTAVYQCFFPLGMSIMLLWLINQTETGKMSWPEYWKNALYFLASGAVALILYLAVNQMIISAAKSADASFGGMTGYAQLDHWGITSLKEYLIRLAKAYGLFVVMPSSSMKALFVVGARYVYFVLFVISIVLICREFFHLHKTEAKSAWQFLIASALLPLSVNLMLFMTDSGSVHALHMITWVIAVIFMLQRPYAIPAREGCTNSLGRVVIALLMLSNIITARYDNNCYLKLEMGQSSAVSYFTTLITRIKSLEGYNDEMPVLYLNERKKEDKSVTEIPELDGKTPTLPYNIAEAKNFINMFTWKEFMRIWCGYDPKLYDAKEDRHAILQSVPENMPHYPNDGSIRIIDGVIIVNF